MSTPQVPDDGVAADPKWGTRLRQTREARSISLRALARRLEVSPGHLSQIERDIVAPSLSLLYSITSELGLSMGSLFDESVAISRRTQSGDQTSIARTPGEERYVCRASDRRVITVDPGVHWEQLTMSTDPRIDFHEIVYQPQGPVPEGFLRHEGHEYGLVLEGRLHAQVEFDTYVLGAGDTISLDSTRPHRFWNEGTGVTRAVWVVSNAPRWDRGPVDVDPSRAVLP